MKRLTKYGIWLLILMVLAGGSGIWALPRLVAAVPSQYRHRLPEPLVALVTTPLPTALPAPQMTAVPPRITIPALMTPTAAPSLTPSPVTSDELQVTSSPPQVTPLSQASLSPTATATPTATPTVTPSPTATPLPPPAAARIDGLEVLPQKFNNCGPATLTISLNFYNYEINQLAIAAQVKPNYDDRNVSPWELRDYVLTETPLQATLHSGGDLTLLKRLIAAGFPVIIEKGLIPSERDGWMGHYLTLFGYDDNEAAFYSLDTFLGPWDSSGRREPYDRVAQYWQQFNYTFLVVYRPAQETAVHAILGPTLLDPLAMWQAAAQQAQTDLAAEADNPFAWFNLGTSLTRLGELTGDLLFYENGAIAFDQARQIGLPPRMLWYQFDPYIAYLQIGRLEDVLTLAEVTLANEGGRNVEETYFYQGHALLAQGDVAGATAAYDRALRLNPNFSLAQQALATINGEQ